MSDKVLAEEDILEGLTQCLECLSYDSNTGFFVWVQNRFRSKVGQIAGALSDLGYIRVTVKKKRYAAHRLAWFFVFGEWPKGEIDHKNGDRTDNRITNLRLASSSQNNQNGYRRPGKSGLRNVQLTKYGTYKVQVWRHGVIHYLGSHKDKELAEFIAQEARKSIHGEYMYGR